MPAGTSFPDYHFQGEEGQRHPEEVHELLVILLEHHGTVLLLLHLLYIVDYRRERGKIQGPGQLSFMEEFTDRDLERLLPYLDFR